MNTHLRHEISNWLVSHCFGILPTKLFEKSIMEAVTTFLFCAYPTMHEGRLSFFRSKQVSNYNLYKLGKRKGLAECMIATKFEPSENWLPPGFCISQDRAFPIAKWAAEEARKAAKTKLKKKAREAEKAAKSEVSAVTEGIEVTKEIILETASEKGVDIKANNSGIEEQMEGVIEEKKETKCNASSNAVDTKTLESKCGSENPEIEKNQPNLKAVATHTDEPSLDLSKLHATLYKDTAIEHLPYILQIQQTLPDKSIADCVEALIGCYLTECGPRGALLLMAWLGLKVLPKNNIHSNSKDAGLLQNDGPTQDMEAMKQQPVQMSNGATVVLPFGLSSSSMGPLGSDWQWGDLPPPQSPMLDQPRAQEKLESLLTGYNYFEAKIGYKFNDRAYLLQAFTHASYHPNDITDCYQRLEFLGDAVLDYVITRHLFEDERKHSPGELTDLRSALVNNNIFAALAVRFDYHKYFKALSVGLFQVIEKYVALQEEQGDLIDIDQFANMDINDDDDEEDTEETEVPKALGDVFESVAGAIFLDSGFSFDAVWEVYYKMMQPLIDQYSAKVPKSPVRELLEMEPETAKFEKPEKTIDGRVRVAVIVIGKGKWKGVGRNYRIAKCACAKRALKALKTESNEKK